MKNHADYNKDIVVCIVNEINVFTFVRQHIRRNAF